MFLTGSGGYNRDGEQYYVGLFLVVFDHPDESDIMPKDSNDLRAIGTEAYFEYHCVESPGSSEAELWYRSHQLVQVIGPPCWDDKFASIAEIGTFSKTMSERAYEACLFVHKIKFADGREGTAFEDELLDSPSEYDRPNPPIRQNA